MRYIYTVLIWVLFVLGAQFASAEEVGLKASLKYSDDTDLYLAEFVAGSERLIARKTCSVADFQNSGGWVKATGENSSRPVYFTYCGGLTIKNRWYLNVKTGRTYQ